MYIFWWLLCVKNIYSSCRVDKSGSPFLTAYLKKYWRSPVNQECFCTMEHNWQEIVKITYNYRIKLFNGRYGFQFIQEEAKLAPRFSILWMTVQIMDPSYEERGRGRGIVQEIKKQISWRMLLFQVKFLRGKGLEKRGQASESWLCLHMT